MEFICCPQINIAEEASPTAVGLIVTEDRTTPVTAGAHVIRAGNQTKRMERGLD